MPKNSGCISCAFSPPPPLGRDDFRLLVTKPYGHETRSTGYRNKHLKLHGSV